MKAMKIFNAPNGRHDLAVLSKRGGEGAADWGRLVDDSHLALAEAVGAFVHRAERSSRQLEELFERAEDHARDGVVLGDERHEGVRNSVADCGRVGAVCDLGVGADVIGGDVEELDRAGARWVSDDPVAGCARSLQVSECIRVRAASL